VGRVEGRPEDNQFRPVIEVRIRFAGQTLPVLALVDSGADITTIPVALGESLTGLDFDQIGQNGGQITGMGAPTASRRLDGVAVEYMGRVFATTIIVGQTPRVVVGRNDFMGAFDTRFYWGHHPPEFWVEPTQPRKGAPSPSPANPTIRPKKHR
jgi:hypothetical protein